MQIGSQRSLEEPSLWDDYIMGYVDYGTFLFYDIFIMLSAYTIRNMKERMHL